MILMMMMMMMMMMLMMRMMLMMMLMATKDAKEGHNMQSKVWLGFRVEIRKDEGRYKVMQIRIGVHVVLGLV